MANQFAQDPFAKFRTVEEAEAPQADPFAKFQTVEEETADPFDKFQTLEETPVDLSELAAEELAPEVQLEGTADPGVEQVAATEELTPELVEAIRQAGTGVIGAPEEVPLKDVAGVEDEFGVKDVIERGLSTVLPVEGFKQAVALADTLSPVFEETAISVRKGFGLEVKRDPDYQNILRSFIGERPGDSVRALETAFNLSSNTRAPQFVERAENLSKERIKEIKQDPNLIISDGMVFNVDSQSGGLKQVIASFGNPFEWIVGFGLDAIVFRAAKKGIKGADVIESFLDDAIDAFKVDRQRVLSQGGPDAGASLDDVNTSIDFLESQKSNLEGLSETQINDILSGVEDEVVKKEEVITLDTELDNLFNQQQDLVNQVTSLEQQRIGVSDVEAKTIDEIVGDLGLQQSKLLDEAESLKAQKRIEGTPTSVESNITENVKMKQDGVDPVIERSVGDFRTETQTSTEVHGFNNVLPKVKETREAQLQRSGLGLAVDPRGRTVTRKSPVEQLFREVDPEVVAQQEAAQLGVRPKKKMRPAQINSASRVDELLTGASSKKAPDPESFGAEFLPATGAPRPKRPAPLPKTPQRVTTADVAVIGGKPQIRPKSGFFAHRELAEHNVQDVYSATLSPMRVALAQDGMDLASGRFGPVFKHIHNPTQEAIANMTTFRNEQIQIGRNIAKKAGIDSDNAQHGKILREVMSGIGVSDVAVPTKELAKRFKGVDPKFIDAAKEYRKWLESLRDKVNIVRRSLGMDEIGHIDNYVPFIDGTSRWKKAIQESDQGFEGMPDFIVPNSVVNPRAFKRMGEDRAELKQNMFELFDDYVGSISKDIYSNPAIENAKIYISALKEMGLQSSAKYWEDYVRVSLIGEQFGTAVKGAARQAALKIQEAKVKGALAGNFLWSLTIQPSSLALTMKEAGVMNTLAGQLDWFTRPEIREMVQKATSMRIKTGRGNTVSLRGALDELNNGIYRTKIDKMSDLLSMFSNAEEQWLHGSSIAAGLRKGTELGFQGDELLAFANNVGETTQSMYNRASRPLIQNNDLFRTLFPFQTFTFEMLGHLRNLVGKDAGFKLDQRERIGQITSLFVGMYLANQWTKAVSGRAAFGPESFVPVVGAEARQRLEEKASPGAGVGSLRVSSFSVLGDLANILGPGLRYGVLLWDQKDFTDAFDKWVEEGNDRDLRKALVFYGLGFLGIGGGAQVNRTIDGLIAAERGFHSSKKGKKLFDVDGFDKLRALVGGPYSTEAGKAFLEERKAPKKKKKKKSQSLGF